MPPTDSGTMPVPPRLLPRYYVAITTNRSVYVRSMIARSHSNYSAVHL